MKFWMFIGILLGFTFLGSFTEWLWDTKIENTLFQATIENTLRKNTGVNK